MLNRQVSTATAATIDTEERAVEQSPLRARPRPRSKLERVNGPAGTSHRGYYIIFSFVDRPQPSHSTSSIIIHRSVPPDSCRSALRISSWARCLHRIPFALLGPSAGGSRLRPPYHVEPSIVEPSAFPLNPESFVAT